MGEGEKDRICQPDLPSPAYGRGAGGEGFPRRQIMPGPEWSISIELAKRMRDVAREFRKEPTPSEAILWEAIRGRQLDGRKFRRQRPIGLFVVDFYCPAEKLLVEVDGPIHALQQKADLERQEILESLGLCFVRISADTVE